MFQVNQIDLEYLFESTGQTALINDVATNVVITNPAISEYEERYIHSLETILQGDIVTLNNEKYLVITESISKRSAKYKALMRHCNYVIKREGEITKQPMLDDEGNQIYDDEGRPIFIDVTTDPVSIPSIIDNKSFSVGGTAQFQVPENQIIVVVQDNEINRDRMKVNDTFTFEGNYKVLHRDFTKRGLMILTCEKGG